jgi:hypothetical protein
MLGTFQGSTRKVFVERRFRGNNLSTNSTGSTSVKLLPFEALPPMTPTRTGSKRDGQTEPGLGVGRDVVNAVSRRH